MTDRVLWGDSRIEDAVKRLDGRIDDVQNEVRAARGLPEAMAKMAGEIAKLAVVIDQHRKDVTACHDAVRDLRKDFENYREGQEEMQESHRLERKTDRRWMFGAVFTAAALVISAVGILAGQFG